MILHLKLRSSASAAAFAILALIISPACASQAQLQGRQAETSGELANSATQPTASEAITSDVRVEYHWGLDVQAPGLAGVTFTSLESRLGYFRTGAGDYVAFLFQYDEERRPTGFQALRRGASPELLGTLSFDPLFEREPRRRPDIPGYEYVNGNRSQFHIGARKFVGIWRATAGSDRLIVNFDDPDGVASSGGPYQILARTSFPATVISTTGDHHGGPSWILLASDPDPQGAFRLMNLVWPR